MPCTSRPKCRLRWSSLLLVLVAGCSSLHQNAAPNALPTLPNKQQVRVEQYVFITDVELERNHPTLKDLEGLQEQVTQQLHIPPCPKPILVYLFRDRSDYNAYMKAHFQDLPSRRAFFMARPTESGDEELLVYTYWGDRVQEDLRHELTHALLHGVLKDVPMWLDEGLAEYFEVPPSFNGVNYRHLSLLRSSSGVPWTPDLGRLEQLTQVREMAPEDYREAWAWVHMMLHTTPRAKDVLVRYLHELRNTKDPGPFAPRLASAIPKAEVSLRQHVAQLEITTKRLPATPE